jgi:hypothetical protein
MYIRARFVLAFCCVKRRVQKHQRRFGAMTQELQELAEWLRQFGVTQVAIAYASYCTSLGRCETFSNRSLFDNLTLWLSLEVRILGPRRGTRPSRCINGRAEDRRHATLGPAW